MIDPLGYFNPVTFFFCVSGQSRGERPEKKRSDYATEKGTRTMAGGNILNIQD